MRDPYKTLGVKRDADTDEIKAAWRTMAKAVHPDHNQSDPKATERFAEIGTAYETLKDPAKRTRYDQAAQLAELKQKGATIIQQRQAAREAAERAKVARANAERVMEELARESAKKAQAAAQAAPQPQSAAQAAPQPQATSQTKPPEAAEDMIERIFGAQARANATASAEATAANPEPKGDTGNTKTQTSAEAVEEQADTEQSAPPASGFASILPLQPLGLLTSLVRRLTGAAAPVVEKAPDITADATITFVDILKGNTIAVPLLDGREARFAVEAGMSDGHVTRLKGQGLKVPGMLRGDVVVTVHVANTDTLTSRGFDLHTTLPVSIENAVLGSEATVQGLDGPLNIVVPAWSGSDKTIRVAAQGLPDGAGGRGDLVVELRLMLWEKPDEKVTDLMRSMREGLFL